MPHPLAAVNPSLSTLFLRSVWLLILALIPQNIQACQNAEYAAAKVDGEVIDGEATIRAPLGQSEIVIKTTRRLAGAIDSVTWNGKEFIDSSDHGRQLQSASNFDNGKAFVPETFNPTEAGSMRDGAGKTSTSRLLQLIAGENRLQTTTQMAFWLAPGETSAGHPATNNSRLSNHLLIKRVTIGYEDLPNVIQYDVTFSLPIDEQHRYAQFEAVTGYMPDEFQSSYQFVPESGKLQPIDFGPGEQSHPIVLATTDGHFAMGIYSPDQPSKGFEQAGYGRFRFAEQHVNKWNCVFRVQAKEMISPGDYSYRCLVILGDMSMVQSALVQLHAKR
jgi:hypothetical protein